MGQASAADAAAVAILTKRGRSALHALLAFDRAADLVAVLAEIPRSTLRKWAYARSAAIPVHWFSGLHWFDGCRLHVAPGRRGKAGCCPVASHELAKWRSRTFRGDGEPLMWGAVVWVGCCNRANDQVCGQAAAPNGCCPSRSRGRSHSEYSGQFRAREALV